MMQPLVFARLGVLVFLAICFLQAGFDKIFDYSGNLSFIKQHFAKSPLASSVGLLVPALTLMEVLTGFHCAYAGFQLVMSQSVGAGQWSMVFSAASFISLFLGQRLAKDYAGAASLTGYFSVAILGAILFSLPQ